MKRNIYIKGFLYLNFLFTLLLLVNLIPRSVIEKNLIKTTKYYNGKENRYNIVNELFQTNHDVVTDCIVFNIISNINSDNVLKSTIDSRYYVSNDKYSNDLKSTILEGRIANSSYSRYWHGYMIFYRTLLIFMSAKEMIFFMLLLTIGLFIWLSILCYKTKIFKLIPIMLISFIFCMTGYSFYTLGHLFPMIIALIGCILIISNKFKDNNYLFFLLGISVAFFDFLSVETLTLTLPLIFVIVKYQENKIKLERKKIISFNIHWLLGYVYAFVYKWILCILVLGKEYLQFAIIEGTKEFAYSSSLTSGISLNINMLFPSINSSNDSFMMYLFILLFICIICFLFHKKDCNKYNAINNLVIVFLIPYIRFFILNNHVVYHYFFTYRAQIASICCLLLIIIYTLDFSLIKKIISNK